MRRGCARERRRGFGFLGGREAGWWLSGGAARGSLKAGACGGRRGRGLLGPWVVSPFRDGKMG